MESRNQAWTPFYFESNMFFDMVNGPSDWKRLLAAYPQMSEKEILLLAQEATYGGARLQAERDAHPNYGFRVEHDGERTLSEFFKEHGMSLFKREDSK